jgi:hypothetical protein
MKEALHYATSSLDMFINESRRRDILGCVCWSHAEKKTVFFSQAVVIFSFVNEEEIDALTFVIVED